MNVWDRCFERFGVDCEADLLMPAFIVYIEMDLSIQIQHTHDTRVRFPSDLDFCWCLADSQSQPARFGILLQDLSSDSFVDSPCWLT